MIVGHSLKYVFVNVPKCAAQSIAFVLRRRYGGEQQGGHYHRNDPPEQATDYYTFAVCRNPYDRAVSLWWSMVHTLTNDRYGLRRMSGTTEFAPFMEWLAECSPTDPLHYSQAAWLVNVRFDAVLRFESLDADISKLPFWAHPIGDSGIVEALPRHNASVGRRAWQEYMTPRVVAAIDDWAGEDFDRFGYERLPCEALA